MRLSITVKVNIIWPRGAITDNGSKAKKRKIDTKSINSLCFLAKAKNAKIKTTINQALLRIHGIPM